MFDLTLRSEFTDRVSTAIELSTDAPDCAAHRSVANFLHITYPTLDIIKALQSIGKADGKPIIVVGERDSGKSHLMAVLYFACQDAAEINKWLGEWVQKGNAACADIQMPNCNMNVICESMHTYKFKTLWDVLFTTSEHGRLIQDKWNQQGKDKTDIPSSSLIEEYLIDKPTVLVLDEFQTWFDSLSEKRDRPQRQQASNFLQQLSDIAINRPDLLKLVISMRDGQNEVAAQLRQKPHELIDFKAGSTHEAIKRDRRMMLLHRLFENRWNVAQSDIESAIDVHVNELLRLKNNSPDTCEAIRREYIESWPFSPELLNILEEVLVATTAQETRDIIRILAGLFRGSGQNTCIITAADLKVVEPDDGKTAIASLLEVLSSPTHKILRAKALANISSLKVALSMKGDAAPHLIELISALWLRSISAGNRMGADRDTLQIDITKEKPIDENRFLEEIRIIIDNSFNIHQVGDRLIFKEEVNPRAKVQATSRNNKEFQDGRDRKHLAAEIRHSLCGASDSINSHAIVVLRGDWECKPWEQVNEQERPDSWGEKFPLIVLPEHPNNLNETLGRWLRENIEKNRNTIRFLLPQAEKNNIYSDADLMGHARKALLAREWSNDEEYKPLEQEFTKRLHEEIAKRFTSYAILSHWDNEKSSGCVFHVETVDAHGDKIPEYIHTNIKEHIYVPNKFQELAVQVAQNSGSIAKLIQDLKEPRPKGLKCNPWLGVNDVKERIARLCAKNIVIVTQKSGDPLRAIPGESETEAYNRIVNKLYDMDRPQDNYLAIPTSLIDAGGTTQQKDTDTGRPSVTTQTSPGTIAPGTPRIPSGSVAAVPLPKPKRESQVCSCPATSPLNLAGRMDAWGIAPDTVIDKISLSTTDVTGADLKIILSKLPENVSYTLDVQIGQNKDC